MNYIIVSMNANYLVKPALLYDNLGLAHHSPFMRAQLF